MTSRCRYLIAGLVSIILALTACGSNNSNVPATNPPNTAIAPTPGANSSNSTSASPTWLTVYFTNPNPSDNLDNGIDHLVIAQLDLAQKSIDVAMLDLNLPNGVNALVRAKKRGVAVRIVVDKSKGTQMLTAAQTAEKQDFDALKALNDAQIPVGDGGRSDGLMDNAIIIVDGVKLFTGSWNMSYEGTFHNNNSLLQISDPTLVANYQAKFNELFVDKKFGAKAAVGALTPKLTLDSIAVENYFSPVDKVMDKIVAEVKAAKKSIKFMAFNYTSSDLSDAMLAQAKAGVQVQGVFLERDATQGSLVPLYCAGLPILIDGNKDAMHHKVIIIDDQTVITGSFNFTQSADHSDDSNILIIRSPGIITLFNQEYSKIFGAGQKPDKVTCK